VTWWLLTHQKVTRRRDTLCCLAPRLGERLEMGQMDGKADGEVETRAYSVEYHCCFSLLVKIFVRCSLAS
jgi:hypothetical protein